MMIKEAILDFNEEKVLVFKEIKSNRWTIWTPCRTLHLGYLNDLTLVNAKFFVNEKSRQRILKTRRRFPHAWIIGKLILKIGSQCHDQYWSAKKKTYR